MLDRDALTDLAVRRYFLTVAARDRAAVLDIIADDCVMDLPGAGYHYSGKPAIAAHFDDFFKTFPQVAFDDFIATADTAAQRIAVRFTVTLTDAAGQPRALRNCNFFDIGPDGRFSRITIWTSAAVSAGFTAGSG